MPNRSKTVIATSALLMSLAAPGLAQNPSDARALELAERAALAPPEVWDHCALLSDLAGLVMTARQQGDDEIRVRSTFADIGPALIGDITAAAFEIPRMRSADDQAFTIQSFAEVYELACYRALAAPGD